MRHFICCAVLLAIAVTGLSVQALANDITKEAAEFASGKSAAEVLDAAKSLKDNAALQAALYEKAYELGRKKPDGYSTAAEAAQLLGEAKPDERTDWLDKLIDVQRLRLRRARGEEKKKIKEQLDEATALRKVWSEITAQRGKLESNSDNKAARKKLLELYVTELDQPAEAEKILNDFVDFLWRKNIPLALKDVEDLSEAESLELGDWYYGFSFRRGKLVKGRIGTVPLLRRARKYYERYLELHAKEDVERLNARANLKKINMALAELTPPIDLLALIDPTKHTVAGKWQRKGKAIVMPTQEGSSLRIKVPVHPDGSYVLSAEFDLINHPVLILTVGDTMCQVGFGIHGGQINDIEGYLYNQLNPTWYKPGKLRGETCRAEVTVRVDGQKATIDVVGDKEKLIHWEGKVSDLSLASWGGLPGHMLGLCVYGGKTKYRTEFRSLTLKMLSGEAKPVKD